MSRNDIGTVLASIGVYAKDFLGRALGKAGASFMALLASPAVWIAVATFSIASFCLGHIEGSAGKRALRAEVVTLNARAAASAQTAKSAVARAATAAAEVAAKAGEIEALKAEIERLKALPVTASAPVAGVPRKPATKPAQKAPPASAPAKPFWPWG